MNFRQTILTLMTIFAVVSISGAAAYVEDWDGGTIEGWNSENIDTEGTDLNNLSWAATLDGHEGVLQIELGDGGLENIIFADGSSSGGQIIENDADGSDFTGAYRVYFDFYTSIAGTLIDLYFEDTSGVQWVLALTDPGVGWTEGYEVLLSYGSGSWNRWDGGTESASTFSASLSEVSEIGILIDDTSSGVFGLDNFAVVPEPEEWLMIGVALFTLAFAFRKKLSESLVAIRVRRY